MSEPNETSTRTYSGGQIGLAVIGVFLCAACGVAWLSTSDGGPDDALTFASSTHPPDAVRSKPAVTTEPEDETFSVQTAGPSGPAFALIVKFDGEPVLDEIAKTFRKDPDGSRAKFRDWASGKPALRGLTLERASYSGELVLTGGAGLNARDTMAAIEAMDNVAYVEPDYSAQPSKGG